MKILYDQKTSAYGKIPISKAHEHDSGFDLRLPEPISLKPGERKTIDLGIKFHIADESRAHRFLRKLFNIGIEGQIRPKSGRSRSGIDVELGTVDEQYRGWVGCTVTNTTKKTVTFLENEKICQIVFIPVFNRITMELGKVSEDTTRGANGFGSSGIK